MRCFTRTHASTPNMNHVTVACAMNDSIIPRNWNTIRKHVRKLAANCNYAMQLRLEKDAHQFIYPIMFVVRLNGNVVSIDKKKKIPQREIF